MGFNHPINFWKAYRGRIVGCSAILIPVSFFAWDRFEANRILKKYVSLSKSYGDAPLSHNQLPTKVTFLVESSDKEGIIKQRTLFDEFLEPILTASGIEYDWIEASAKKHSQQLDKEQPLNKDELHNDANPSNINNTSNVDNFTTKENKRAENFTQINSWRIYNWLAREMDTIEAEKKLTDIKKNESFYSKLSFFLGFKSAPNIELVAKGDENNLENKSEKENVLLTLTPDSPGLKSFQQGILVMGTEEQFTSTLASIHKLYEDRSSSWLLAFGQYPLRIGFISSTNEHPFIKRIFCKRHLAHYLCSQAFTIASDQYAQLDPNTERNLLNLQHSSMLLSSTGTVLLLSPIVAPNVASVF